jgi:penicillin amidase
LPVLRAAVPQSARAKAALSMLKVWNSEMAADRVEPLIFNAWMRMASFRIFSDELGVTLMNDYAEQRNTHQPTVNVLLDRDGQSKWCLDVTKQGTAPDQGCDRLLSVALEQALDDLEQRYGSDMEKWRWGEAHVAHSEHRPFSKVNMLAGLFDLWVPSSGDTFTVNVGRHNPRDEKAPYESRHAASLRALYDLSDLENSRFIHSTGQSGNRLSALYDNYVRRWADVAYVPMKTRRKDVEKNRIGVLRLLP